MKQTTKNLFRAKKAVDYLNKKPAYKTWNTKEMNIEDFLESLTRNRMQNLFQRAQAKMFKHYSVVLKVAFALLFIVTLLTLLFV